MPVCHPDFSYIKPCIYLPVKIVLSSYLLFCTHLLYSGEDLNLSEVQGSHLKWVIVRWN